MPVIKKVLFLVDFSDSCLGAARYVEAFAGLGVFRRLPLASVTAKVLHDPDCLVWLAGEYQAVPGILHATAKVPAARYVPTPATAGLRQDEDSLAYEPTVRASSEPQGWEWTV